MMRVSCVNSNEVLYPDRYSCKHASVRVNAEEVSLITVSFR